MGMHCDSALCAESRTVPNDNAYLRKWERIYDKWDAKFPDDKVSLRKPRHARPETWLYVCDFPTTYNVVLCYPATGNVVKWKAYRDRYGYPMHEEVVIDGQ